jgi:hypothetical protein
MTPFAAESMMSNLEQDERLSEAAGAIKGTVSKRSRPRRALRCAAATETDDAAPLSVCAGTSGAGRARALARPRRRADERQAWRTGGAYVS